VLDVPKKKIVLRGEWGKCWAGTCMDNFANFNPELFFNIQLYTERLEKFIHTEKN
jgi:hypothetical protein